MGQNLVDRLTTSLLSRAGQVAAMIRELMATLPTVGRPMVVGFSQGGLLTFTLAMHHSDVVEAAFPLSAWLPPALVPRYRREDLVYPRIRGMHGLADPIIEAEPTVDLYAELQERGFEAELETFDGVGHVVTDAMNDRLHVWLAEAMGLVVEEGIRTGQLDGGAPPCLPIGEWPLAFVPDGGWPEGARPRRAGRRRCDRGGLARWRLAGGAAARGGLAGGASAAVDSVRGARDAGGDSVEGGVDAGNADAAPVSG
ncbi:MAG: dienelactone hydrolase family protein [Sandaracinaceae bacterium]